MEDKNFWQEIIDDLEYSTKELFKYLEKTENNKDIVRIEKINSLIKNMKNYKEYEFLKIPKLFSEKEIGYTTLKLRVKIFAYNKGMLVIEKDKHNNLTIPSNWVEYKLSVKESSLKYFNENFNLELKPEELIAVNKKTYNKENIIEITIIGKVEKIHDSYKNCIFIDYNKKDKYNKNIQNYKKIIEILKDKDNI